MKTNLAEADLRGANLTEADLREADLRGANLNGATLTRVELVEADLRRAELTKAYLFQADLEGAALTEANLRGANLRGANLRWTNLIRANLIRADLSEAKLINANLRGAKLNEATLLGTDFTNANLADCAVYGASIWDVTVEGTIQTNIRITPYNMPLVTVDNLKVAQFIYLLLNNAEIRDVIDTIAKKAVLILGRFTPERKLILDRLREELRQRGYLPILFDFEKPESRDITETVSTLAHMARFIIADITAAKSIPQELSMIIPNLPSVPVQPLIHVSDKEYGMFEHFRRYPWVLAVHEYDTIEALIGVLVERVIQPAEQKAQELRQVRTKDI